MIGRNLMFSLSFKGVLLILESIDRQLGNQNLKREFLKFIESAYTFVR